MSRAQRCSQPQIAAQAALTGQAEELSGSANPPCKAMPNSLEMEKLLDTSLGVPWQADPWPRSRCAQAPRLRASHIHLPVPPWLEGASCPCQIRTDQSTACPIPRTLPKQGIISGCSVLKPQCAHPSVGIAAALPWKSSNSLQLILMLPWLLQLCFCTCWQSIVREAPASL